MGIIQYILDVSRFLGALMLVLLLFAWFSEKFTGKCPKCGGRMIEYDDDPDHDYCENECKN